MGIIHTPDSEWAKEATKWEAHGTVMGPGLRPYEKRDWPSWVYLAGQLPAGGIDIIDSEHIDEHQYDRMRAKGYRLTPLEAIEALSGQQLEYAKLSAERTWETKHRLSPKAVAEVEAAEDAAGAQHLPTIPETPLGPPMVHVTSDREIKMQADLDAMKAQIDETHRLIASLAAAGPNTPAKTRRGRPKKSAKPAEAES